MRSTTGCPFRRTACKLPILHADCCAFFDASGDGVASDHTDRIADSRASSHSPKHANGHPRTDSGATADDSGNSLDSSAASPSATPDAVKPSPTSSPSAANLDVRPTLSSQSANEYLRSYDDYISDFKSAYKAMKEGDMTKYQTVIQRARELQTKSEKLGGELNPEEEQRFADYLNKKANELAQFASQNR